MCERAPGNGFRRAMHSPTGSMVACGKALGREEGYWLGVRKLLHTPWSLTSNNQVADGGFTYWPSNVSLKVLSPGIRDTAKGCSPYPKLSLTSSLNDCNEWDNINVMVQWQIKLHKSSKGAENELILKNDREWAGVIYIHVRHSGLGLPVMLCFWI